MKSCVLFHFIVAAINIVMSSHQIMHIPKLKGRENWDSWKIAAKSYLVIKGLWKTIEPTAGTSVNADDDLKARSELTLLLEPINYSYIVEEESAKNAWKKLTDAFEDSGTSRRVDTLQRLVTLRLIDCESMEDYISKMTSYWLKVKSVGFNIESEIVGSLLLGGLPMQYRPLVMGMENSGKALTADYVKTVLLQDVPFDERNRAHDESAAMWSSSKPTTKNKSKSQPRHGQQQRQQQPQQQQQRIQCYECNGYGHYARQCPNRKKALQAAEEENAMFLSMKAVVSRDDWFIDSGASSHMTMNKDIIIDPVAVKNKSVVVANKTSIGVESCGDVRLELNNNGKQCTVRLKGVLYVPELCTNLISVSQVIKNGNRVVFDKNKCIVYNQRDEIIATASLVDDMYKLNCASKSVSLLTTANETKKEATAKKLDPMLWHRRLGHVSIDSLPRIRDAVNGMNFVDKKFEKNCIACLKGKQCRLPFNHEGTRATAPLELIHSDICGPMPTESIGRMRYYVSFVDDYSHLSKTYAIRLKSEAFEKFKIYKSWAENQTGYKIKKFRTDGGMEFCHSDFEIFLRDCGIVHQKTAPHSAQQNGVAERFNRTIVEKIRSMLCDAKLPKQFWAEALATAVFIVNRVPCRSSGAKTPIELWSNVKPDLSMMRVFGCKAMVHVPKANRKKLDEKSTECIFLGYSDESKAYRLYNTATKKIIISRDVVFIENRPNPEQVISKDISNDDMFVCFMPIETVAAEEEIGDSNSESSVVAAADRNDNEVVDAADDELDENSLMNETELSFVDAETTLVNSVVADSTFSETFASDDNDDHELRRSSRIYSQSLSAIAELNDPQSVEEAMKRADSEEWRRAMSSEMNSLIANNTWSLTDLPAGRKPIDCKWVFKLKSKKDDNSIRYKARLVAKGYSQREGIDYTETYSPVVKYTSIRLLLALAVKYDLKVRQLDVVTAFLHGELKEEIYMLQPEAFNDGTGRVCKLNKALYGLKQAGRSWYEKLHNVLEQAEMERCEADQCVYVKITNEGILILAEYVDDMLSFSNNESMENSLVETLKEAFEITDLGNVSSVVGMRVIRDDQKKSISIDQSAYISQILTRFGMNDCNPCTSPMDSGQTLSLNDCPKDDNEKQEMDAKPYQELIGCLTYLAHMTRPDICFATTFLSRFNKNPGEKHWGAAKRVLRYLKGTRNRKLTYMKDENELVGYCDADHAGNIDNRRSTSGYAFIMQGAAISWAAKAQATVSLSTAESEYASLVVAMQECVWLRRLLSEIRLSLSDELVLHCDNKSALQLALNGSASSSPRTKHLDIKDKFIREQLSKGTVKLAYIETNEMIADILTKAMTPCKQTKFSGKLGLL